MLLPKNFKILPVDTFMFFNSTRDWCEYYYVYLLKNTLYKKKKIKLVMKTLLPKSKQNNLFPTPVLSWNAGLFIYENADVCDV